MKLSKRRGCEHMAETISMRCGRCGCVMQSQPLPVDPKQLAFYPPPEGWELFTTSIGLDDYWHCTECVKDVARGCPEVIA